MMAQADTVMKKVETVEEDEPQAPAPVVLAPLAPRGILPSSSEMAVIRQLVADLAPLIGTDFLPRQIDTPHKALAIVLKGRELGIPPMEALAQLYVVNGKVTMQAQLMLALIARSGLGTWQIEESTAQACTVVMKRSDNGAAMRLRFTIEEAKAAGLLGKSGSAWSAYPAAMLRARAISACARIVFPDVIGGMYTPEELDVPVVVNAEGDIEIDAEAAIDEPSPEQQAVVDAVFEESAKATAPRACSKCGRPMALRDGKRGKFWSCTGWRRDGTGCDHTENYREAPAGEPNGFEGADDFEGRAGGGTPAPKRQGSGNVLDLGGGFWLKVSDHALERAQERFGWDAEEAMRRVEPAARAMLAGEADEQGRVTIAPATYGFKQAGQTLILQTVYEGGGQGDVPLAESADLPPGFTDAELEEDDAPVPAPDVPPEDEAPASYEDFRTRLRPYVGQLPAREMERLYQIGAAAAFDGTVPESAELTPAQWAEVWREVMGYLDGEAGNGDERDG